FDLSRLDPDVAETAAALRAVAARSQTVVGPYVPIDVPALLAAGMTDALDAELATGRDALSHLLTSSLATSTALPRPVDPAAVNYLHGAGADHVIVDGSALTSTSNGRTLTQPIALQLASGTTVTAVAGDSGLERLLGSDDAPGLAAQRLLAGLALVTLE